MHGHEAELLTTTFLMLSAIGCGLVLKLVKQPPLVGYILAGLFIGPSGMGLIDYSAEISSLAELGIILLLFIIGMELSVKAFLTVVRPAVIATMAQIMCSILLAFLVSFYFSWSGPQILLVGFILTLSSTAVALMVLDQLGLLRAHVGQLTVGVLVAQDIAVVPMLVFAGAGAGMLAEWPLLVTRIGLAVTVLGVLLFWIARTARLRLPFGQGLEDNIELSVLLGLGLCFMAASLTGFMGLSPVFGAFCAGLAISHTNLRKPILEATHPLQSLLIVIFFVSIGLLVDLNYVSTHWGVILLVTVAVLCLKTIFGWVLLYVGGEPAGRALVSSLITPQIGEFSFVLTTTGVASGIFISEEADFLLAVIAASLFVSPIWTTVLHYLVVRSKIHLVGEPQTPSNLPT